MGDIQDKDAALTTKIVGAAPDGTEQDPIASLNDAMKMSLQGQDGIYSADVELSGGKHRLLTETNITSVNIPQGRDPIPDTYFTVTAAGAIGDTIRVQIAATSVDSTIPDVDLPAVDVTITVTAIEVGNERLLAELVADTLTVDPDFIAAFLDAEVITGDKRAVVHITSTEFSISGEFHERPNSTDVQVSVTGANTVILNSDKLISRPKQTVLSRDPNNPHELGVIGIQGQVRIRADEFEKLFFKDAETALGITDLTVNGLITPLTFLIEANPAGGDVIFINQLKLHGIDTNIKVSNSKFMGLNSALINGITIIVYQDGIMSTLPTIKSTRDLLARFGTTASDNKIIGQSGGDFIESVFDLDKKNVAIVLHPGTADRIEVTISDNLSQIDSLILTAEGFEEED